MNKKTFITLIMLIALNFNIMAQNKDTLCQRDIRARLPQQLAHT